MALSLLSDKPQGLLCHVSSPRSVKPSIHMPVVDGTQSTSKADATAHCDEGSAARTQVHLRLSPPYHRIHHRAE